MRSNEGVGVSIYVVGESNDAVWTKTTQTTVMEQNDVFVEEKDLFSYI